MGYGTARSGPPRDETVFANGVSTTSVFELSSGSATVFIESIQPPMRLVVFGAGQDAVPLVRQAALLGWDVTVADPRPAMRRRRRRGSRRPKTVLCVRPSTPANPSTSTNGPPSSP
ncbi:MAG: XdhC family protein [Blastocatellia bacterium]|nr:XdhC family protein [Blastocatellia bacterium]